MSIDVQIFEVVDISISEGVYQFDIMDCDINIGWFVYWV